MHIRTRSWRRLSKEIRDGKLLSIGISSETLERIRAQEPRKRLIESARVALTVDQEPNADLVDFIAGYNSDSGVFHHFATIGELFSELPSRSRTGELRSIEIDDGEIDLVRMVPNEFREFPIHVEEVPGDCLCAWQKVPGGVRSTTFARRISKLLFFAGVILYSTEGSKHLESGASVELANATPGIHKLFLEFLEALGVPRASVKFRVQLHDIADKEYAMHYWSTELGVSPDQFYKPLMAPMKGEPQRKTYTLTLKYNNSMLSLLLTAWGSDPEKLYSTLGDL